MSVVLYSIEILKLIFIQLVQTATNALISTDDIWSYFEDTIVPEIRKRQLPGTRERAGKSLGELLVLFVKAAPIHKVCLHAS